MEIIYCMWGMRRIVLILQNVFFNIFFRKYFKSNIHIFGFPIIHIAKKSTIKIGKNLVLISSSFFNQVGVSHPVLIRTNFPGARIEIGNDVGISGATISASQEIVIGNNVLIGANCVIIDTDFHPIAKENRRYNKDNVATGKVCIENNVFIGMNSIILKGVRIGENSVIGAGSVVTKEIPPNSIAAGNPARVLSYLK